METNPSGTILYTTADNHLSTDVFEFPEYVSRNRSVSAVSTGGGDKEGAYKFDVNISTACIPNCRYLSYSDKKHVIDESKNKGLKLGDWKGSKTGNEQDKLKELTKQDSKVKSNFKALKKNVTTDNNNGDNKDEPEDYDDQF